MNSEDPTGPIAPHCHLSTTSNQLMKRTKSDIIPNLTIVSMHWSKALEVKDGCLLQRPLHIQAAMEAVAQTIQMFSFLCVAKIFCLVRRKLKEHNLEFSNSTRHQVCCQSQL
ncbi:hypothetical protein AMECASPLE_027619 [Ameca splendens]|uniref:Uncharacterized protein n=1 Tax=Ameca splendens TaxID=208324 RepID=A0ABV0Y567_9TELE